MVVTPNKVSVTGIRDTIVATGALAAPALNTAIATLTAAQLIRGVYSVTVSTQQFGTVDAVNNNANLILKKGGAFLITAMRSAGTNSTVVIPRVTMDGASVLNVVTNAAAGAGSVYYAEIIATQVE